MPPFDDFMDLRRHESDAGFRVKGGLGVDRDGHLTLNLAGPLYVNAQGEIDIRVGGGLAVATGLPKMLVMAKEQRITGNDIQDSSVAGAKSVSEGLARLAALIVEAQLNIGVLQTDVGALNSALSAIVSSPIKARGTATLVAGTVTVATVNVTAGDLIFLTYGAISGVPGSISYGNIVDDTSFDITSSTGALDDSDVAWMVVGP